jgi:uncharacterized protein (TIGR00159 family)
MEYFALLSDLRIQDVLDVLFLSFVAYHLFSWFQGTKALKALIGLVLFGIIFIVARTWGLFLTTWVFEIFWQVLVILLIVLFQSEIRQVLEKITPLGLLGLRRQPGPDSWINGFCQAVFALADKRIGALAIIERTDAVPELTTGGRPLQADPVQEVLLSVFQKASPLHDGAVLIRQGRIVLAATYLPLSPEERVPSHWGTRHRAALGLTERCDALVVTVSEERGEVTLAKEGRMEPVGRPEELDGLIREAIVPGFKDRAGPLPRAWEIVRSRWLVKLGTVGLVAALWLLLAGQQDFQASFRVPLKVIELPRSVELVEPLEPEIEVTVRGLRKEVSLLSEENVKAVVDMARFRPGKVRLMLNSDMVKLPSDRVKVVRVRPEVMTLRLEAVEPKDSPDQGSSD